VTEKRAGRRVVDVLLGDELVEVGVDGEDARFLEQNADLSTAKVVEILPAMSGGR